MTYIPNAGTATGICNCSTAWWGINPPPPCPVHTLRSGTFTLTFPPTLTPARLHPDDIEAIAKRVAELVGK